ncbi:MAG: molybdopterin synthase [Acidobacteria bacterium]|nr:molybdopterin synthase [Acidobacteriota bacterium]
MAGTTIEVRLRSFGPLQTVFPTHGYQRKLPAGESLSDLLRKLCDEGLMSEVMLRSAAIAINHTYALPGQILHDGDEIAILPPVSGGTFLADNPNWQIALVRETIDAADIVRRVKSGEDGAICVFDGTVRNNSRGRQTLHLDYEAYEEMALKQMLLLRAEAIEHYGVREVAIVHRLGRLLVGETSILIAVASAHRGAAFDACEWLIDTLKKTVPIWKREQFIDGAAWVDGEPFPENFIAR